MKKIIIALSFLGITAGSLPFAFAGHFVTGSSYSCDTQITRNLQVGSENNEVLVLQNMLRSAGYLHANPNGYYGQGTKSAVKQFQVANGIYPTGMVGEATRNAINERLCDNDVRGDSYSYDAYGYTGNSTYYGYNQGVTYVDQYDPYVRVISSQGTSPFVYQTPGNNATSFSPSFVNSAYTTSASSYNNNLLPATTQNQIQSTGLIYNPSTGYSYNVVPQSGSITITSPMVNSYYNEGDTVYMSWSTSNLNVVQYQILLENTSSGQRKEVAVTQNNNYSFVLTKELLDAVCAGTCNNYQQGSFRIVVATPMLDIAGGSSMFRAAVSPISIKRPYYGHASVTISASQTPVNSSEKFKLYVNIPTGASWDTSFYGNYTVKIRAVCPSSVAVVVAGVPCGQDFIIPLGPVSFQQEIPAMITNTTWYRQEVPFEITVTNLRGEVLGTSRTTVVVNPAPFNW